jgi:hypothetical protein
MENDLLNLMSSSRSDLVDACGCTPPAVSSDSQPGAENPLAESTPSRTVDGTADASRRKHKLVVMLTPADHGQYRAALALGSEGCDPFLRTATVTALPDALDQVPTMLEEAEARWRLQPRNRAVAPAPSRGAAAGRPAHAATPPHRSVEPVAEARPPQRAERDVAPSAATDAYDAPKRTDSGQLTLFG